jgi:hypothetical protein
MGFAVTAAALATAVAAGAGGYRARWPQGVFQRRIQAEG